MPTFRYEAAHDNARIEAGEIEADSTRAARAALRARGLVPISVEAVAQAGAAAGGISRSRLPASELALATRQLASLIGAGLSLEAALSTLVEQADTEAQQVLFRAVRADVTSGHRFADALARHPGVFPPVYCASVAAGEQAGSFATVLERLAQYLEDRQALRAKLLAAAAYPAIVTVVALGVVLFLTGAQLALGSCDFSKNKHERFATLVTAGCSVWNVGLGFVLGWIMLAALRRGYIRL